MSDLSHTPGPWAIYGSSIIARDLKPEWAEIDEDFADKRVTIVDVTGSMGGSDSDGDLILMAASPDMLAALKAIKELAKPGQTLGISEAIDLICDIYNTALKALPTGGDA